MESTGPSCTAHTCNKRWSLNGKDILTAGEKKGGKDLLALIFCFCLRSSNKLRSPEPGSVTLLIPVLVEGWTKGCGCFPSSPPNSYKPSQRLAVHPEPRSVPWESSCGGISDLSDTLPALSSHCSPAVRREGVMSGCRKAREGKFSSRGLWCVFSPVGPLQHTDAQATSGYAGSSPWGKCFRRWACIWGKRNKIELNPCLGSLFFYFMTIVLGANLGNPKCRLLQKGTTSREKSFPDTKLQSCPHEALLSSMRLFALALKWLKIKLNLSCCITSCSR